MSDILGITQQKNNDSLTDSKYSGLVFTITGNFSIIFFTAILITGIDDI